MERDDLITRVEAARLLGVSGTQVGRLLAAGQLERGSDRVPQTRGYPGLGITRESVERYRRERRAPKGPILRKRDVLPSA
jgi:hypothetical protein